MNEQQKINGLTQLLVVGRIKFSSCLPGLPGLPGLPHEFRKILIFFHE